MTQPMTNQSLDDDPPPMPPVRPERDDCCHSGCEPCVFDLYDEALERYEKELRAWQQRRMREKPDSP
jgi:hypothetical protein